MFIPSCKLVRIAEGITRTYSILKWQTASSSWPNTLEPSINVFETSAKLSNNYCPKKVAIIHIRITTISHVYSVVQNKHDDQDPLNFLVNKITRLMVKILQQTENHIKEDLFAGNWKNILSLNSIQKRHVTAKLDTDKQQFHREIWNHYNPFHPSRQPKPMQPLQELLNPRNAPCNPAFCSPHIL